MQHEHVSTKYTSDLLQEGVNWETMRRFHGHLGPWLALGLKIGADAYAKLQFRSHFGVKVLVKGPMRRPITCMLDGLQWSTGATLGKGNIAMAECSSLSVEIVDGDGRSVRYSVPVSLGDQFANLITEVGEEEATYQVWNDPLQGYCEIVAG